MGQRIDPQVLTDPADRCLLALARLAYRGSSDKQSDQHWFITSAATLVEGYADGLLRSLVEMSDMGKSRFGSALLSAIGDDPYRAWDSRLKWLRDGFSVSVKGDKATQGFLTLVDARNAIVHGEGKLTRLQAGKIGQLVNLSQDLKRVLDIDLSSTRLVFSPTSCPLAVAVCREFVRHLDEKALEVEPRLKTYGVH
ncbi:hypothetical protein HCN51_13350 [Nonomuraea sp. FMUSA5-5]|uniref:RiboL-PSP-HEPN domain-containing protein n=1 Tax=Nonomuraea composti TaxID=2720023 RepID=A0ABX1B5E4_9ACTN|nr:hypothetical protein [Nonomuraea sp. FMUSA5-5]NJP90426.1 hypothetical protein [Nonomuraea sp. FMUSA5-5]